MQTKRFAVAVLVVSTAAVGIRAQSTDVPAGYLVPPRAIVDILDVPPTPTVVIGQHHERIALLERRSMPAVAELAEPIYRIAGARINPKTNGRQVRTGTVIGITIKTIADGTER